MNEMSNTCAIGRFIAVCFVWKGRVRRACGSKVSIARVWRRLALPQKPFTLRIGLGDRFGQNEQPGRPVGGAAERLNEKKTLETLSAGAEIPPTRSGPLDLQPLRGTPARFGRRRVAAEHRQRRTPATDSHFPPRRSQAQPRSNGLRRQSVRPRFHGHEAGPGRPPRLPAVPLRRQ